MNIADVVVICILMVILVLVGRSLYRRRKRLRQGGGCCDGCTGCSQAGFCKEKPSAEKAKEIEEKPPR